MSASKPSTSHATTRPNMDMSTAELVQRLGSDEESVRKMAVFKLQTFISDPSFADVFIHEGGLPRLRYMALNSSGNTLAYCLTSFSRLLELDMGWDYISTDLIRRVVELVITQPLVNVNRGATSMLAVIMSNPHTRASQPGISGYQKLKPIVDQLPEFLPMLVEKLASADHALCANCLQLINALMRDTMANEIDTVWAKFIKRLQELGFIKSIYGLMQSSALQDLAHPLLESQSLTKLLLRKWKEDPVNLEKPDHRRALQGIHHASKTSQQSTAGTDSTKGSRRNHSEKWRRLGFETESPTWEFEHTGFLGLMDLTDFVYKNEDSFQKLLLEQTATQPEKRCPIARASLAVTAILFDHFEIDKREMDEAQRYVSMDSRAGFERAFKPLLLHWSRLHTCGLNSFVKLWRSSGATVEDFGKIEELVRILVEQVVGQAPRTKDIKDVEEEIVTYNLERLRELQMELLELTYEDAWDQHLRQVRDELSHEALQFLKEQRVRCLLKGAWFPAVNTTANEGLISEQTSRGSPLPWRYIRLSYNRRFLHYADFANRSAEAPKLEVLDQKLDLNVISSVASNVSASPLSSSSSEDVAKGATPLASSKITIHGYTSSDGGGGGKEVTLLQLHPQSYNTASEWLDGLLMLLNQQPITADTTKLVEMIGGYGLKIRLLNVRFKDLNLEEPVIPSREGLDENYYYDIGSMESGV